MAAIPASLFEDAPISFGPGFLKDHAHTLISDPRIAIVELIANAYDAGATEVVVKWPVSVDSPLEVLDNGTGMSGKEFAQRWKRICYNRMQEQGPAVAFPPGVSVGSRMAFGQSGKGRFAGFCFADSYHVETWKDGICTIWLVQRIDGEMEPFRCVPEQSLEKEGHGTRIWTDRSRQYLPVDEVIECIGTKFLVDPTFTIVVNEERLRLLDLEGVRTLELKVDPYGSVRIHRMGAAVQDRTTRLRGITWWVNKRMVGHPSWDGLDERDAILDGRKSEAKRYSFVVEADLLKREVNGDWTGFTSDLKVDDVKKAVRNYVSDCLDSLLSSTRKERKITALREHTDLLRALPRLSRQVIGQFADDLQRNCPRITEDDLSKTVGVLANLERARSGYELLGRLASCSPDDLDTWNRLMQEWDATSAEIVLSELRRRLELIKQLQEKVHVSQTDELLELQPLFAKGLWIFGPEYESVDFTSNRGMVTVLRKLFRVSDDHSSRRRPDFVVRPGGSLGVYTADAFQDGEVAGVRKVLIVELKKGAFKLTCVELRQGEDYAQEIRKRCVVGLDAEIEVFVLGAALGDDANEPRTVGNHIKIVPMTYDVVLSRAHARTFHLLRKIEESQPQVGTDPEVDTVLSEAGLLQPTQPYTG